MIDVQFSVVIMSFRYDDWTKGDVVYQPDADRLREITILRNVEMKGLSSGGRFSGAKEYDKLQEDAFFGATAGYGRCEADEGVDGRSDTPEVNGLE